MKIVGQLKGGNWRGYTKHRDGLVRWYKGETRAVCGNKTALRDVDAKWDEKRNRIDATGVSAAASASQVYRVVLGEFLTIQKARVGADRNAISERTYYNYVDGLNSFGSFRCGGRKVADTPIRQVGPEHFTAYAATFRKWKASGFDSVVTRIGAFFRWAVEMDYIDRYRPGPQFIRPAKQDMRDERIDLSKTFTVDECAKLYVRAGRTMRCWVALGLCAAFTPSDIANLPRSCVDLSKGVIDFRRRKTGKVRRVIPLPADVVDLLRRYQRAEPHHKDHADLFFLTEGGEPYSRMLTRSGAHKPTNPISTLFARLMSAAGVERLDGRNFTGLRTTFFNRAPRGEWDLERKIIMGRAAGTVDYDSYLEDVWIARLVHVVNHVWNPIRLSIERLDAGTSASASP